MEVAIVIKGYSRFQFLLGGVFLLKYGSTPLPFLLQRMAPLSLTLAVRRLFGVFLFFV